MTKQLTQTTFQTPMRSDAMRPAGAWVVAASPRYRGPSLGAVRFGSGEELRPQAGVPAPFQGTDLPRHGAALGLVPAAVAVLVPPVPGSTPRRPPA
jgi:hypothetical protein